MDCHVLGIIYPNGLNLGSASLSFLTADFHPQKAHIYVHHMKHEKRAVHLVQFTDDVCHQRD